jgi:chromosomal replication initiation ATPase DnaA
MRQAGLEVWPDVLSHLRRQHPSICRRWFEEELRPVEIRDGTLSIRAQSDFHRDYLTKFCSVPFSEALQSVTGRLLTVRFLGPNDDVNASRHAALQPTSPSSVPPVVDSQANNTTSGSGPVEQDARNNTASHAASLNDQAHDVAHSPADHAQHDHNGVSGIAPDAPHATAGQPADSPRPAYRSIPRSPRAAHEGTLVINPDYDFNSSGWAKPTSSRPSASTSSKTIRTPSSAISPAMAS